ncbi:phage tail tape measure protein [Fulvimarina endophytica]|nr:phage tail tape measure protein [Fulvimarina endophytica]
MARSMNLDVLVRLRDRMSGPMRRLRSNIQSLSNVGRQIGFVGTAIAAISFIAPIREAAAFEQQLLDIAGTAELTGKAAFDFARTAGRQYEDLALKIGQTSDIIAQGAGGMIAAGVDEGVINRNIETIGKAATAANAEMSDMTAVATSLLKTLNVPETALEGSIASLVVAGKEGAFELKDMARYFPQLTSQMRKFGVTGREAVDFLGPALQIAKTGAADPSVAANNLNNFLSKALAPVTQKAFKSMGVDIQAVMLDAATKGINPIEAMIQKVGVLTGVSEKTIGTYMRRAEAQGMKGADALGYVREQLEAIGAAGSVGELFGDQQVLDFIVPFLASVDEYKRIKGAVSSATGEVIDGDYETQMAGLNRQLTIFGEIGTQAVRIVGFAFGTWLPGINQRLMSMLASIRALDASTGGWVTQALVAAGGAVLLTGAIGALGLALPIVIAGLSALASLAAVAIGPIGLIIGAIALGAAHVAQHWDRYGPRLMRMWDRTRRGFQTFSRTVLDNGRSLMRSGRELYDRYGPAVRAGIGRSWELARRTAVAAWSAMPDFSVITARLTSFETIRTAGLDALSGALERLRGSRDFALAFFDDFTRGFSTSFAGIDVSGADLVSGALRRMSAVLEMLQGVGQGAVDRLSVMLETVKRFFAGFGGEAGAMGEGLGEAVRDITALASSIGGLIDDILAIGNLDLGIDWKALFGDAAEGIGAFIGREIAQFGKDVASAARELTALVEAARSAVAQIVAFFAGLSDRIMSAIGPIDFFDRFRDPVPAVLAWFSGLPRRIGEAIGSINLSGLIDWPSLTAGMGEPLAWNDLLPGSIVETATDIGAAVKMVSDAVRSLFDLVTGIVMDWTAIFPSGVVGAASAIAGAISAVTGALNALAERITSMPSLGNLGGAFGGGLPSGGALDMPQSPGSMIGNMAKPPAANSNAKPPANANAPAGAPSPERQSSAAPLPATKLTRQYAAAQPPSRADVSGTIRIAVEGPGKVTSAESSNSRIAMAPSRGRRSNVA